MYGMTTLHGDGDTDVSLLPERYVGAAGALRGVIGARRIPIRHSDDRIHTINAYATHMCIR
jgi:hypothetical protein